MHHKITSDGLGSSQNGPKIKIRSRLGGFGNCYESDDDDDESNMTSVGYDHIPLTPGLSHIVKLELGSDPMVFGPERKVSEDANDYELSPTSSSSNNRSSLNDAPAEIRPLYDEEPTVSIEPETPNRLTRQLGQIQNPKLLNKSRRSKDILQLQLAMQKQTEFDEQYRDMDHRLHCINKLKNSSTTPTGTRSRSHSPCVPQDMDLTTEDIRQPQEESSRKRKSPTPAGRSDAAVVTTADNSSGATQTSARRSSPPILLQSTYVRRPHKKQRKTAQPEKAKTAKQSKTKKSTNTDEDDRFKRFQNTQWHDKFQELLAFRKENGHCQVPHTWPPNPQLARWVKRQRYQFKLRCEGKLSTMTEDRVQLLNEVGFVWDSHAAAWQEKYEELKDYVRTYKTFNMGNSYATHPQLATWVKCQRRQYKLLMMGQESNMTAERKELLEDLGFLWGVRNQKGGNSPK